LEGKPYRFDGLNIYNANSSGQCNYAMATGSTLDNSLGGSNIGSGQEAFRAWFFQSFATRNGVRDWSAFDHTLAVARSHGDRVIVTLGNQWGDCEQVTGYRNQSWYASDYKTQRGGGMLRTYRDWVGEVVARYRNDPTILMWQLMNEAEDANGGCSSSAGSTLKAFASDMGAMVKSIDGNHLLSLGTMGSGQCGTAGSSYSDIHSVAQIDVCEYHDYDGGSVALPSNLTADLNMCKALNKPLFIGESGIKKTDVGGTGNRAAAWDAKFRAQYSAGVVGELIWDWDLYQPSDPFSLQPGDPAISLLARY
jgi:endo-1,4-beta-mannosidase